MMPFIQFSAPPALQLCDSRQVCTNKKGLLPKCPLFEKKCCRTLTDVYSDLSLITIYEIILDHTCGFVFTDTAQQRHLFSRRLSS